MSRFSSEVGVGMMSAVELRSGAELGSGAGLRSGAGLGSGAEHVAKHDQQSQALVLSIRRAAAGITEALAPSQADVAVAES